MQVVIFHYLLAIYPLPFHPVLNSLSHFAGIISLMHSFMRDCLVFLVPQRQKLLSLAFPQSLILHRESLLLDQYFTNFLLDYDQQ